MIACENPECAIEWFHFACVGLKAEVSVHASQHGQNVAVHFLNAESHQPSFYVLFSPTSLGIAHSVGKVPLLVEFD